LSEPLDGISSFFLGGGALIELRSSVSFSFPLIDNSPNGSSFVLLPPVSNGFSFGRYQRDLILDFFVMGMVSKVKGRGLFVSRFVTMKS
jgi:hypothetical protein